MDFLRKSHVKTEISIYCNGIFEGKKIQKKLSLSGSGNAQNFYSPLFTREKSCMLLNFINAKFLYIKVCPVWWGSGGHLGDLEAKTGFKPVLIWGEKST